MEIFMPLDPTEWRLKIEFRAPVLAKSSQLITARNAPTPPLKKFGHTSAEMARFFRINLFGMRFA
jgi:hypothetical protein